MRFDALLILLIFLFNQPAYAQSYEESDFTRYTKLDGLSHNYITGIVHDSTGYIWVATYKGLNRFDGKSFINFFKHSENSPIPENIVLSIGLQNQNELIGTTVAGAFSYNNITGKHQYFIVPADSVIFFWANQAWHAVKDKRGNYVVSTKTGLYVFNPAGKIISRYDHYQTNDAGRTELWFGNSLTTLHNGNIFQENNLAGSLYQPINNKIDTLYAAKRKQLKQLVNFKIGEDRISFPGLNNELFVPVPETASLDVYNLLTDERTSYPVPAVVLSDFNWYSKLFYINDSLLAITSKVGGFYLLHYSALEKKLYCETKKQFASKYCTSIFTDHEKRLWVGTKDGLYKQNIRNSFFNVQDLSLQDNKVMNTGIQSVFLTNEKIFVGLGNEGGLLLFNKKTGAKERQLSFSRFGSGTNTINYIFLYHPDTLWLGTGRGIVWLNLANYSFGQLKIPGMPEWLYETKTRNYLEDSERNIWLSFGKLNSVLLFNRKQYRLYDLTQSPLLKITFCFSMAEDKNHNIWLAGDGICRWNRKLNKIDTLIPFPAAGKSRFNYMQILACDEQNNLWLTSFDNEILQLDCNSNHMYLRLPENNMIDGFSVTNTHIINNHIWMGMLNGISAFNIKDHSIKQFNYADGLPSAAVTSYRAGSFYHQSGNRFYFGAGKYLVSFIPDVTLTDKFLPRFSIEVTGNNKKLTETVSLPFSQNEVELRFNAINFTNPEENRFAYRFLDKKEAVWRELNDKNAVVLSKLSAGNHRIEVKLYSVNNRWPAQVRLINIQINPPFWRTYSFILAVILLLIAAAYAYYRYRILQINKKANLDKLLLQTEMKALHSQMNPHFIFNSLNSIREMILSNENNEASRYLSKFAHLMRTTLNQSEKTFVSLRSTIEYLERYIEMEKIRNNMFTCTISKDEALNTDELYLPPMLIQPFIENAIWHGRPGNHNSIHIQIDFKKENQLLVCTIDDDGIGIDQSLQDKENKVETHQSLGIANIKNRIRLLNEKYNLQSSVTIEDKSPLSGGAATGTRVTLNLPLKLPEL